MEPEDTKRSPEAVCEPSAPLWGSNRKETDHSFIYCSVSQHVLAGLEMWLSEKENCEQQLNWAQPSALSIPHPSYLSPAFVFLRQEGVTVLLSKPQFVFSFALWISQTWDRAFEDGLCGRVWEILSESCRVLLQSFTSAVTSRDAPSCYFRQGHGKYQESLKDTREKVCYSLCGVLLTGLKWHWN